VYAIEAAASMSFAELLATANGFRDRVEFIHKPSTAVVLPERVDTIVADIHDTFGFQQNGLATLIDARDRFLAPGGRLIPSSVQLLVAPVEAPDLYRKTVDIWRQRIHGVDLSPLRALAVNQPNAARFEPERLLATPATVANIDLNTVDEVYVTGTTVCRAARDGTLHGICGCFVTTLADEIVMTNMPGNSRTTNFAQAFFPVERPTVLSADDTVSIQIETQDGSATRWQVAVARQGTTIARFDQCTFHTEPLSPDVLRKQADDYRPTLSPRGAMERAVLDQFDGTRSSSDIEAWLRNRFGDTLPSAREAAAFLKSMIHRCG